MLECVRITSEFVFRWFLESVVFVVLEARVIFPMQNEEIPSMTRESYDEHAVVA
jgi:hypothetical protein